MEYHKIIAPPQSRALKSGRVILKPGEEVGLHKTEDKEEIIVCIKGNPTLVMDNDTLTLNPGETAYVKEEKQHNMVNNTDKEVEYVYIVTLFEKNMITTQGGK